MSEDDLNVKNKNLEESTKLNVEQLTKSTEESIASTQTLQRKNKENSKNL